MSDRPDNAAKQLDALLDALQKSLLDASDEEIVKELQAHGLDPLKAMQLMNFADERAVDEHFRRVREGLAQQRAEEMRKIDAARGRLPASRKERLDLLKRISATHGQALTAQFREMTNLDNLSDAELEGMLQDFAALGYVSPEK
jgi:hypothetical protein